MIRDSEYEASDVFLGLGSNIRHPLSVLPSLHRVLRDQFPGFISTMRVLRHPTAISPHFVSFAWRYLGCTRCFRSLPDECNCQSLELVTRYLHPGICRGAKKVGLSQVPGEPQLSVCHVPNRLRQDCLRQTIATQQRGPWYAKSKGSHDWVFRSSIAWLSDSLCTLRDANYSNTTQHSLPVAGQALLDGVLTRKVPMKGFKFYILFPFPKLSWRK